MVILSELASIAKDQGWMVVNVSGTTGLIDALIRKLRNNQLLSGISVKAGASMASVELNADLSQQNEFETLIEAATHKTTAAGKGLLITIDEVQDASEEEMRTIATQVQFLIREEMDIVLVFAGITTGVMDLLNGKAMTFLRRAKPEELKPIPLSDVKASLRETIERSGLVIKNDALETATQATAGYAYLIQLVGYHVWRTAWLRCRNAEGPIEITSADAQTGVSEATEEFRDAVLETAISGLPKTAIDFALAMSETEAVVATSDITRKLGKTTGYLSPYRRQLIARQVIEQTAPGYVTFSIPFMKEFLQDRRTEILARYGA